MKLYRVCTENKNYDNIINYLDNYFPDGYTVINTNGAWQGQREKSLIIEIAEEYQETEIRHFAYWLRKHNEQETVMVQVLDIGCWML